MKKLLEFLKKLLIAPFMLYIYNLIASPFNLIVPINVITVLVIGFFGIPGLLTLIIFKLIAF